MVGGSFEVKVSDDYTLIEFAIFVSVEQKEVFKVLSIEFGGIDLLFLGLWLTHKKNFKEDDETESNEEECFFFLEEYKRPEYCNKNNGVIIMSIYKNIFHYYRGQTRKGSEDTKQLQIENNTTKAFLNVLQSSSPKLTKKFITWIGLNGNIKEDFEYMYQVSNELHRNTHQAVVIGIAETNKVINVQQEKKYYIPDGAILSDSISILIETKIGLVSYLELNQLEGHKQKFAINQKVHENILLTWEEIRTFFKEQHKYFKGTSDVLTCFLLEQFEEYCVINCIGGAKTYEYFFLQFEKVKAQKLARKIHTYIWKESDYSDIEDAGTRDGIGYKRLGKPKFATLSIQRQRHFILHIGKKGQKLGIITQEKIDKVLGRPFDRQNYDDERYPHEAYIRLEWVDDFEEIRPFIDLAYKVR